MSVEERLLAQIVIYEQYLAEMLCFEARSAQDISDITRAENELKLLYYIRDGE